MRTRKWILRAVAGVVLVYLLGAIALAEISLHPIRVPHHRRARLIKLAEQSAQSAGGSLQNVSVKASDGIELEAWYAQPAPPNGNAVVLLHGVGDSRAGMAPYMDMFLERGYSVLVPDSRGHGTSGGIATYGLLEANDIHAWVDWLQANKHPACIFGLGESMGAAILLESLKVEHRFCAVVAESPFADFREAAYDRVSGEFGARPWLAKTVLRPAIEGAFVEARVVHDLDLETVRPEDAIAGSTTRILLIHGAADTHIRLRHSQELHESNPRTELWIVPGVEHTLVYRSYPQEFSTRVVGFFARAASANRPT